MIFRKPRRKRQSANGKKRFLTQLRMEGLEARALMDAGMAPQLLLTMRSGDYRTVRLDASVAVNDALAAYREIGRAHV